MLLLMAGEFCRDIRYKKFDGNRQPFVTKYKPSRKRRKYVSARIMIL